jgi:predicted RNase H-like HicB family nuclease
MRIVFEQGEDGWIVAVIPQVPGAASQGRTREEARENVIEALRLMLRPDPDPSQDGPGAESEPLELTISA